MNMKDILHNISDKSDAEQSLWYSIEQQMKEENLMRKSKNRRVRFSLTMIAALIGIIVIGSISFGRSIRPIYHPVTLTELETMATPINLAVTHEDMTVFLEWAYADPGQIVLAYTVFDAEGNALTGSELEDVSTETRIVWDADQYSSFGDRPSEVNPDSTRQIAGIFGSWLHFQSINELSEGEFDFTQAISLDIRFLVYISHDNAGLARHQFDFELPYRALQFEQHRNLFSYFSEPWNNDEASVESIEVYFNDFMINDSISNAMICLRLPDDAPSGIYFLGDVNLFVDGDFVENGIISSDVSPDSDEDYSLFETYNHFYHEIGHSRPYCGLYSWHIAFDTMPDSVRVELGEIAYAFADDEESAELYRGLFSAQGYDLSYSRDDETLELDIDYPDSWWELSQRKKYLIGKNILEAFHQENGEAVLTGDWEYTFNITEEELVIQKPLYNPVTLAEIEAMATPLNLVQTLDDITIQLDWAYADANQIILAYTPYDADANPIPADDFAGMRVGVHYNHDNIERRFGGNISVSNGSQQIARLPIIGFSFEWRISEGEIDLRQLIAWDLRAEFFPEDDDLWLAPEYIFDFRVPLSQIPFEQHNQVFDPDVWINGEEVVSDFEINFNDLVITDSATTLFTCVKIPDDVHYGIYFPREVNLYADEHLIGRADLSHDEFRVEYENLYQLSNSDILFESSYMHRTPYPSYCVQFVWHMMFDELPDTLRIEIPELRPITSQYFVIEEEMQTYGDLFAEEGYELTYRPVYRGAFHYESAYPGAFNVLDEAEKEAIFARVWNAFDEIYPRDERYSAGWEYTFELD